MSANNIVIIIKEKDDRFRAYHRDMNAYCEGLYDYVGPCFVCKGAGKQGSDKCPVCVNGHYSPPEEQAIFEAPTIEAAIQEYNHWVRDSGTFVEYGYQFVGLEPNATTVTAMEEKNLPVFDTAEELLEDLHERHSCGKSEEPQRFNIKTVTAEQLSQICVCDWLEGVGDITSLAQVDFIRKFGARLLEQRDTIRNILCAIDRKLCTKREHQKYFLNDALHVRDIADPETPGGGGCIYCIGFRLASENKMLREKVRGLEQQLSKIDKEPQ